MIIVEIIGGLGNQMFQYAFYFALKKYYKEDTLYIYLNRYNETKDNQGFELQRVFNINEPIYNEKVDILIDDSSKILHKIRRKIFGFKKTYFGESIFKYDSLVFDLKKADVVYFRGLWQDELYFKNLRIELLNKFNFALELNEKNLKVLRRVNEENSVSIHVRRGDYISNKKYKDILGNICSIDYYRNATKLINEKFNNVSYFVFSDNISWVKSNFDFLSNLNVTFISHNINIESWADMYLMSKCKHNIIANSSFSWWGAWLNQNPFKIVIAPKKWFKNNKRLEKNNIVPCNWIKIEN